MDVDIDNDFDGKLLDQFRSMGTTDRDVLIAQFQTVLGNSINPELCAFFLDMNNWNLQNAVCSYYDFDQPSFPSVAIVADTTVGEGESVAPNTRFYKSWRLQNPGVESWPPGCHLRFCSGHSMSSVERKIIDPLSPGEIREVSIEMTSPADSGKFVSSWRMCTPTGVFFGDVMHVRVDVADGGLLGLTQQLSRIGESSVHSSNTKDRPVNPFQVPHSDSSSISPSQDQQSPHVMIEEDSSLSKFHISSMSAKPHKEDDSEMSYS